MTAFFTADWHLGHHLIIKYSDRPFNDTSDMNEALVQRCNETVGIDDELYFLGDIAFCDPKPFIQRIKAKRKYLILGNHDQARKSAYHALSFNWIKDVADIKIGEQRLWLSHYCHRVWPASHYDSIHLYGHSHGRIPPTHNSLDTGVDCWDFRPCSLDQIKERLATIPKPVQQIQQEDKT